MSTTAPTAAIDRPAMIRHALRSVVAERGFHGASMASIAKAAGVAAGTAYVHYASKDDVVAAAYDEAKDAMTDAALVGLDRSLEPAARFRSVWLNMFNHLRAGPDIARFLLQVETSPYAALCASNRAAAADAHPLLALFADAADRFIDLPPQVRFDLGFGPAIRLAAAGEQLSDDQLTELADACWRAVYKD